MGKKRRTTRNSPVEKRPRTRPAVIIGFSLALVVLTYLAYTRVKGNEFLLFDDNTYVYANGHIQQGITSQSLRWAFNKGYAGNWHPLTWISHMVDWRLFGNNPGGHHLVSLLLHMLNTVLLFLVIRRMTSRPGSTQADSLWKSAFVAALFAVHPLHVESVAWVAERKDVLSTFFWLLTMGAYILYSEKPGVRRYLPVILLFALGLMAKPMLVTLPLALILMDYWPLKRNRRWTSLVLEKTPLLAMSAASCVITFLAQSEKGYVGSLEKYTPGGRIANALVGYVTYLWKTVWPRNLAVLYPYHGDVLPIWQAAASAVLLIGISVLVLSLRRKRPYLVFGWLWYLGTLVPVIGLVQVGRQAIADRYTYVPLIGLFVAVVWLVSSILPARKIAITLGVAVLAVLAVLTHIQVGYWKTSIGLFEHTLSCTSGNYVIQNCLAVALARQGRTDEAVPHYEEALRICPDYLLAHYNYAQALATQGKINEAISHLMKALEINPNDYRAHFALGVVYECQGKIGQAISEYRAGVRAHPDNPKVYLALANLLAQRGELDEAAALCRQALEVDPSSEEARLALEHLAKD